MKEIIVVSTPTIPGMEIQETLGLARGSTTRARFVGRDIVAAFRILAGGEVPEYTKLLMDAREQAIERMIEDAGDLGADAVINVRFTTSNVASGASEILAYGTAVKLKE